MSKFTVDQALQQAVAAHKSGQLQKADRLYTAILRSNPRHPDANHNMGVLAISVGKVDQALPFFKTALNESPGKAQFWISYIDTLTKLGKWSDARTVFDQAKKHGAQGNGFDDLENRLDSIDHVRQSAENVIPETSADQPNSLDALTLEQALRLAQKKETEGSTKESKKIYQDILNKFPKNKKAIAGLKRLVDGVTGDIPKGHGLSKERVQSVIDLYNQGRLNAAVEQGQILIEQYPESWEIWNILGAAAARSNQLEQAIVAFRKVIAIKPDHADAYHNLGIAQQNQGELDEAVETFTQALNINPNQAETYNALGNALQTQGKLDKAIETYNKALNINPDHASAYNNLGNALRKQARLEPAVEAYNKAITIKADYAEAYNNLGVALNEQAKKDKAIQAYNRAITIKPDFLDCAWNLSSATENIDDARGWLDRCLEIDPNYLPARLHLSALKFYQNDDVDFNALMQTNLKTHPFMRSFSWIMGLPTLPKLFFNRWALFDHVMEQSKTDRPFYEFGVWRGDAFKYLVNTFKKGYGFDTFEGLPEAWHHEKAGSYSSQGNVPQIEGGHFVVGRFEETLEEFFNESRPKASIINFDADLYSSTICALNHAKTVIDEHTLMIFDELIMNYNWEQDEFKALNEFCSNNNCNYEVLAVSFFTKQVAVKLTNF